MRHAEIKSNTKNLLSSRDTGIVPHQFVSQPVVPVSSYCNWRYAVRKAVEKGILQKPDSCSRCGDGNTKINGHHVFLYKSLIF